MELYESIKVKLLSGDLKHTTKLDWIKLYSKESVQMMPGDFHRFNLGVSMIIPDGYEAIIIPEEQIYENWSVIQTNAGEIIPSNDDRIWTIPIYAFEKTFIASGANIAKFRIQKTQPEVFYNLEFE